MGTENKFSFLPFSVLSDNSHSQSEIHEEVNMKNRLAVCMVIFSAVTSIGCTTAIKYDLRDLQPVSENITRQEMKVAVAPFQDLRPQHEKSPPASFSNPAVRDSMFKDGDVPRNMSEAFVTHFNHVKLFKIAEMTDSTASLPSPDALEKLRGLGYSMLLTGKIKRFYGVGHANAFDIAAVGLSLIPITVVVTIPIMLIQQNDHETAIELIDLQLTDTSSGAVKWSGSFFRKKELEYYDVMPVRAVSDTLKEIVQDVVKQIEVVQFE